MRADRDRLSDMLEAIAKIEERTTSGKGAFERDEMLQVWVVHHIQIIGEAAAGISDELRHMHSNIPWRDVIAMRNVLVHQYFGIDIREIWTTVQEDLPYLRCELRRILREMPQ